MATRQRRRSELEALVRELEEDRSEAYVRATEALQEVEELHGELQQQREANQRLEEELEFRGGVVRAVQERAIEAAGRQFEDAVIESSMLAEQRGVALA